MSDKRSLMSMPLCTFNMYFAVLYIYWYFWSFFSKTDVYVCIFLIPPACVMFANAAPKSLALFRGWMPPCITLLFYTPYSFIQTLHLLVDGCPALGNAGCKGIQLYRVPVGSDEIGELTGQMGLLTSSGNFCISCHQSLISFKQTTQIKL